MLHMHPFQTNLLAISEQQQLDQLVELLIKAKQENPTGVDVQKWIASDNMQALIKFVKDPSLAQIFNKDKHVLAQALLFAQIKVSHYAATMLFLATKQVDEQGQPLLSCPNAIKQRFLHVCVHSDLTDVSYDDSQPTKHVYAKPVEERSDTRQAKPAIIHRKLPSVPTTTSSAENSHRTTGSVADRIRKMGLQ